VGIHQVSKRENNNEGVKKMEHGWGCERLTNGRTSWRVRREGPHRSRIKNTPNESDSTTGTQYSSAKAAGFQPVET